MFSCNRPRPPARHRDDRTAPQDLHDHHDNSYHGTKTHKDRGSKVSSCGGDSIDEFDFVLNTTFGRLTGIFTCYCRNTGGGTDTEIRLSPRKALEKKFLSPLLPGLEPTTF